MIASLIRSYRKKLYESKVEGSFWKTEDPAKIEVMGYAGFDFVILDMEYGLSSGRSLQGLIRAAQLIGILPIVRIKENNYRKNQE